MSNVYTKTGDKGETGLLGGSRIWKDDLRVSCYGTLDEANSMIGVANSLIKNEDIKKILNKIQKELFILGAELASDDRGTDYLKDKIGKDHIRYLEDSINKYIDEIGEQKNFIIPGKTTASSILHVARTIVRRAERAIVSLNKRENIREEVLQYVNRLSDTLFTLARVEETYGFIQEVKDRVLERLNITEKKQNLNLDTAKKMASAAEKKARDIGIPVIFSVVDEGGSLILLHRMDESLLASIDISINKAYTAAAIRMPTHEVGKVTKPGTELYGLQWTNNCRIVTFGGGYPLRIGDRVVGGIGVSGGTVEQDMIIASHALRVFELERRE
jgi:ATP:cob(I)alamin adenosyltransferase